MGKGDMGMWVGNMGKGNMEKEWGRGTWGWGWGTWDGGGEHGDKGREHGEREDEDVSMGMGVKSMRKENMGKGSMEMGVRNMGKGKYRNRALQVIQVAYRVLSKYFDVDYNLGKWGWGNGTTQRIGNNGGGAEQEGEMSIGMRRVGRDMGRETLFYKCGGCEDEEGGNMRKMWRGGHGNEEDERMRG
ncbi:hypothetical protein V8E53_005236 [Lactarius tabidus]